MIVYRNSDPRYWQLWVLNTQPAARWHGTGEGPAHYFADTPTGAWAEFLRHEEITDPNDLAGVQRSIWAVDIPQDFIEAARSPRLPLDVMTGDPSSYAACQDEARRLRRQGATALLAPSAAVKRGEAAGWRMDPQDTRGPSRDGQTIVLFTHPAELVGWCAVRYGQPEPRTLDSVHHF